MLFQIVVLLGGKLLFTTESIPNDKTLISLLATFTEKFPLSEGYEVNVKAWKDKVTV